MPQGGSGKGGGVQAAWTSTSSSSDEKENAGLAGSAGLGRPSKRKRLLEPVEGSKQGQIGGASSRDSHSAESLPAVTTAFAIYADEVPRPPAAVDSLEARGGSQPAGDGDHELAYKVLVLEQEVAALRRALASANAAARDADRVRAERDELAVLASQQALMLACVRAADEGGA